MSTPTTIRVRVTAEHIRKGERHGPGSCPIALALQSIDGNPWSVGTWSAGYAGEPCQYLLSRPAMWFIRAFDDGKRVKPATFVLRRMS